MGTRQSNVAQTYSLNKDMFYDFEVIDFKTSKYRFKVNGSNLFGIEPMDADSQDDAFETRVAKQIQSDTFEKTSDVSIQNKNADKCTDKQTSGASPPVQDQTLGLESYSPEVVFESLSGGTEGIGVDGIAKLLSLVGLTDITDMRVVWVCWIFKMKDFRIERNNYFDVMRKYLTFEKLKKAIPTQPLSDPQTFSTLFVFSFSSNLDIGEKRLPLDTAVDLLHQFYPQPNTRIDQFVNYLTTTNRPNLTKDEWSSILHLMKEVKPDYSNYDMDSSWPILFDDFVKSLGKECKN
ncbi:hypothetical protein EIN_215160 [Entamoeba invadens IP1]|uniref:Defective in cullin neddylation protein n=1 Tax=Entamoeba invadens IP1 TaxID=370355 RepID=A0A0A1U7K9_ENTIV|nr:hypothetical protein EIN_215160 [Entamoeba invadens IP1]ELP90363.1 hypothetical protein EIN_215160 [Entamoeba invadens IP1]|eukprot:XP_004257134.1 hypothetical protein EIN_215160 [Entamoeba invadens IP1]